MRVVFRPTEAGAEIEAEDARSSLETEVTALGWSGERFVELAPPEAGDSVAAQDGKDQAKIGDEIAHWLAGGGLTGVGIVVATVWKDPRLSGWVDRLFSLVEASRSTEVVLTDEDGEHGLTLNGLEEATRKEVVLAWIAARSGE